MQAHHSTSSSGLAKVNMSLGNNANINTQIMRDTMATKVGLNDTFSSANELAKLESSDPSQDHKDDKRLLQMSMQDISLHHRLANRNHLHHQMTKPLRRAELTQESHVVSIGLNVAQSMTLISDHNQTHLNGSKLTESKNTFTAVSESRNDTYSIRSL